MPYAVDDGRYYLSEVGKQFVTTQFVPGSLDPILGVEHVRILRLIYD